MQCDSVGAGISCLFVDSRLLDRSEPGGCMSDRRVWLFEPILGVSAAVLMALVWERDDAGLIKNRISVTCQSHS